MADDDEDDEYSLYDAEEAARWYLKAAEQGDAESQCRIGYFYYIGVVYDRDFSSAREWFARSADQGFHWGQFFLGEIYRNGYGIKSSNRTACKWYRAAANQGNNYARMNLGRMYLEGMGVKKDPETAERWFELAGLDGETPATMGMYYDGKGTSFINVPDAVWWYRLSAKRDSLCGKVCLAKMYRQGRGVAQDYQRALELLQECADKDYAPALQDLGEMYEKGEGVELDIDKANSLYMRASDIEREEMEDEYMKLALHGPDMED